MKKTGLAALIILWAQVIYCQENPDKWLLTASSGIEKHDKRLFNYSEKELLLRIQPEKWGTYHLGLDLNRKVLQSGKLSTCGGLGLSYEKATFNRPFDHFYFETISFDILRHQDKYEKLQVPISFLILFEIIDNWYISGTFNSQFLVYRSIGRSGSNDTPFKESTFELEEINLNLGISYQIGDFYTRLSSRLLNYQKIDKIIFNYLIKDPGTDQSWEWYNPLRFDLTIGYVW